MSLGEKWLCRLQKNDNWLRFFGNVWTDMDLHGRDTDAGAMAGGFELMKASGCLEWWEMVRQAHHDRPGEHAVGAGLGFDGRAVRG